MSSEKAGPGLKRELGFWDLLAFGVAYMAPVAAFAIFGFVNFLSDGGVVPAYVIAAIALAFTAVSYGTMASAAPSAGSSFAYARLALGPIVGFIAGWAILLDYLLLPALASLYAGIYLNAAVPEVPVQVWLAGFLLLSVTVNLLGVRWSTGVDLAISAVQFLFCAVFAIMAWQFLAGSSMPVAPLWPASAPLGGVVTGAATAVITYLGFDAVMTLTEEVKGKEPGRVAGRAALASVLVMMCVYTLTVWLLASLGQGLTFTDPSQSAFVVLYERLPSLVWPLSIIAALALGVGGTISMHVGVSRLLFAMAREGQLPSVLARVHPRTQVPWVAVLGSWLVIAAVAFAALPYADVLAGLVSFGALTAFLLVNVSVIAHFGVRQRSRLVLLHWVAPLLGALVVGYVLIGIQPLALEVGAAWLVVGLAAQAVVSRKAVAGTAA